MQEVRDFFFTFISRLTELHFKKQNKPDTHKKEKPIKTLHNSTVKLRGASAAMIHFHIKCVCYVWYILTSFLKWKRDFQGTLCICLARRLEG